MAIHTSPGEENSKNSYATVIKEIGSSTKDLIQSEMNLILAETKLVAHNVGRHSKQVLIFGGLLVMSVLPFLAFAVIGLGLLLDGRYWLSSLIVSLVCAAIGGPLAYSALRKIKDEDLKMPHSKAGLNGEFATLQKKFEALKTSAQGEHHESH